METIHAVGIFLVLIIVLEELQENIVKSMLSSYFYDAWL